VPDHEGHVADLQARIRERLDELRPVAPDSREYVDVARRVLDATAELIEYEERLPLLVDEGPQRISALTLRWAGWFTAAAALALTLAVIPGWIELPWLALTLPLLLIGARMPFLPVHPPNGPHLRQRIGAALVAAAVPVALFAVAAGPRWTAGVAVLLAVAGLVGLLGDPVPRGDGGPADPDAETPPTGLPLS
jgi:hypothetical protein